MRLLLVLGACSASACSTSSTPVDASVDSSSGDSAQSADVVIAPICDGGGGASFQYVYSDGVVHSACLPMINGIRTSYTTAADGGCGTPSQCNATAVSEPDQKLRITVRAALREIFATTGSTTVGIDLEDDTLCPDASSCSFAFTNEACAFNVDIAGGFGKTVMGSGPLPCTLDVFGLPPTVEIRSLVVQSQIEGTCTPP